MKRSKKMTLILVAAMVMTVAMVVVAYAEYVYHYLNTTLNLLV